MFSIGDSRTCFIVLFQLVAVMHQKRWLPTAIKQEEEEGAAPGACKEQKVGLRNKEYNYSHHTCCLPKGTLGFIFKPATAKIVWLC